MIADGGNTLNTKLKRHHRHRHRLRFQSFWVFQRDNGGIAGADSEDLFHPYKCNIEPAKNELPEVMFRRYGQIWQFWRLPCHICEGTYEYRYGRQIHESNLTSLFRCPTSPTWLFRAWGGARESCGAAWKRDHVTGHCPPLLLVYLVAMENHHVYMANQCKSSTNGQFSSIFHIQLGQIDRQYSRLFKHLKLSVYK